MSEEQDKLEFENITTEEDLANNNVRVRITWEESVVKKIEDAFPGVRVFRYVDQERDDDRRDLE